MANKKMWNRNYDNLFSAAFGWKGGYSNVATPTENIPLFRIANGGAYYSFNCADDTVGNGLAAANASLNKIGAYITSPNQTLSWATQSYGEIQGFTTGWAICLGSGNEDPVYDGYNLLTPIYSNMRLGTVSRINTTYDASTHTYTYGYKVPIAYSGSDDIVINEFGLYVPLVQQTSGSYTYLQGSAMMIYHEVFEEGIILHQNDTIEITITQSVIQPNYTPYPSIE